jgi:hypothetical protein
MEVRIDGDYTRRCRPCLRAVACTAIGSMPLETAETATDCQMMAYCDGPKREGRFSRPTCQLERATMLFRDEDGAVVHRISEITFIPDNPDNFQAGE